MTLPTIMPAWNEMALLDLVTIKSGQVDPRAPAYRDLPLIAPDHLAQQTGRLLKKESAAAQGAISGKYLVNPGDVIYSKIRPYLQKAYKCDFEALCSADMYPFTPRPGVDASFVLHTILGRNFTNFATSVSARSGIPKINRAELSEYRMPVPPAQEQRAIGRALDDVDDLVATLEQLINKKQAIKQGLMQQLLTGRTRLPNFADSWRTTETGSLLEFKNGLNKASEFFGSGTPIVNFMDVMNGPTISAADLEGRVTLTRDEVKRFSAKRGDLFFTRTSETIEEVGTAAVLVDDVPDASFSGFILRGRPRSSECDSRFLAYMFQIEQVRRQVTAAATYTTRALTNGRSLGRVILQVPPLEEQRAISSVLRDGDAQIFALRERIKKARRVKQGMMQELLTGRTRIPTDEAVS
jgi:type I restriction enzyme S subunit